MMPSLPQTSCVETFDGTKPSVIEFIGDAVTASAGISGSWDRSHFNLLGGIPWINYYHVFFDHSSNDNEIVINIDSLKTAIDALLPKLVVENPRFINVSPTAKFKPVALNSRLQVKTQTKYSDL